MMFPCRARTANTARAAAHSVVAPTSAAAIAALPAIPLQIAGANHQGGRLLRGVSMTCLPITPPAGGGLAREGQGSGGPRGLPSRTGGDDSAGAARSGSGETGRSYPDTAGTTGSGAAAIASPCPLTGSSSRRTFSISTRGWARAGCSTTAVVAGLKAEPNAVVRGSPAGISEESNAIASASQSDAM